MAMKREKQYDMFDVATGACSLDDYLFQRYSENDLSSSFWIDEKDEVDELRAPKPQPDGQPGTEPEVIPIQGPRAPKKSGPPKPPPLPEGLTPDSPPGPARIEHPPTSAVDPPTPDGMDSLAKDPSGIVSRLDSLQKSPPEPFSAKSEEFQASSKPNPVPSRESFESSLPEASQDAQPPSSPPSMEDLLARFHQATKEYQERSQTEPTDDTANPDNDGD
jgi:hypothetical protein